MHTTEPVGSDAQYEGRAQKLNGTEEGRHASEGDTTFADHADGRWAGLVE